MACAIRSVTLVAKQPDVLAAFYATFLGLRELARSPDGHVSLTDGFYNLTLLKNGAPDTHGPEGLRGFGIHVDDVAALGQRLREHAPETRLDPGPGGPFQGEYRLVDPVGLEVQISSHAFGVPDAQTQLPCIRHMALAVPKHEELLSFYVQVFGFRETRTSLTLRQEGSGVRFFGDGHTSVALLQERTSRRVSGRPVDERRMRSGLNHIGILVPDLTDVLHRLPASAGADRPPHAPPMAEYRAYDPEGNGFDLSQEKGYEIDLDRWVRQPAAALA